MSARRLAAFHLPVWTVALCSNSRTEQDLLFSSGVTSAREPGGPATWASYVRDYVREHQLAGEFAILVEDQRATDPHSNHRMEIINL